MASNQQSLELIPAIPYTSRDFTTILAELRAYVEQTRPDAQNDFLQSTLGSLILELAALVGDVISFGQDAVAAESFLASARRYESALRFARSVGYVPRSAVSAEVQVETVSLPTSLVTNGGLIPAGTKVKGGENVIYELQEDVNILAGDTVALLTLREGESHTETFQPTAREDQEVVTTFGVVEHNSWKVYVGSPGEDTLWTQVDNLTLVATGTKAYQVSFDAEGRLVLRFGNGQDGAIPNDTITVVYRTTSGAKGNASPFAIRGTVAVTLNNGAGTASVTVENTLGVAAGGRDRETLDELRLNIPAYIQTVDKVITLSDFDAALRKVSGVALTFTDLLVSSYAVNIVKVHAWASESIEFVAETYDNAIQSSVPYTRYAVLPPNLINDIQAFLRPRTPVCLHATVVRPNVAWVDVYLRDVVYDTALDPETVHAAIANAVVNLFQLGSGFVIRVSDLYEAIDQVEGVRSFYIERTIVDYIRKGFASGAIQFVGNANPTDGEVIRIDDGADVVVFEFDSNNALTDTSRVRVAIGANAEATAQTLANAIRTYTQVNAFRDTQESAIVIRLEHTKEGSPYNRTILKTGDTLVVTGLTGGSDAASPIVEDRRRQMTPARDLWPPGTYTPGTPFTGNNAWRDGGQLPYKDIRDIVTAGVPSERRYYDETYQYNNEIYYDSGVALNADVQAINLRRLVMNLIPYRS